MDEVKNAYFAWLCRLVGEKLGDRYTYLLRRLDDTPFYWTVRMDENRAGDGMDLRYRFTCEQMYDMEAECKLSGRGCSMLEMMAALSLRCDEDVTYDFDIGSRAGIWFYNMLESLGLLCMTDDQYDDGYVDFVIQRFLRHDYEPNGKGGLFTVPSFFGDMRQMEIWNQMNTYLRTVVYGGANA